MCDDDPMESVQPSVDLVHEQVTAYVSTLDDVQLVKELRALLGARLVAYLADASSTAMVADLVAGVVPVSDQIRERLHTAYTVAALQHRLGASSPLIQAWFQGRNPRLNDKAPARVIAEDAVEESRDLIAAATTLVGG